MGQDTKLGVVENDIIRMKRKDLYIEFQGTGIFRIVCWKCGARIEEITDDYVEYLQYLKNKQGRGESHPSPKTK
jgi:hypothetical protein